MNQVLSFISGGLLQFNWWQIVVFTLIVTHLTICSVTLFLHRAQAHRGLELHPIISHFFRFWLWLTTGMVTKEWVAIHRKHHARCEREGDPHSPIVFGIWKVFFQGAELYRQESTNQATLTKFGYGTPDDWLERNVYAHHSVLGVIITLGIDIALFGALGLTVWAVQMAWIPFWAAGMVNGVGHYVGYRNFDCPDSSTNIFPWGIIIGGEELHNNHHAHGTSAKFSNKWYEFDLGWFYISILRGLGLAKVKRVAPKLKLESGDKSILDLKTLQGVITHRYEIMGRYSKMLKVAVREELIRLKTSRQKNSDICRWTMLKRVRRWLQHSEAVLHPKQQAEINQALALEPNAPLSILVSMRRELGHLWESSSASSEQLLHDLQAWCQRAQQSGIHSLEQFAYHLRRYAA